MQETRGSNTTWPTEEDLSLLEIHNEIIEAELDTARKKVNSINYSKYTKFTPQIDVIIRNYVNNYGTNNWEPLAKLLNRTVRLIKERWQTHLNPNTEKYKYFSKEEDDLLIEKFNEYGAKWKLIAKFFPSRAPQTLRNRYNNCLKNRSSTEDTQQRTDETTYDTNKNSLIARIPDAQQRADEHNLNSNHSNNLLPVLDNVDPNDLPFLDNFDPSAVPPVTDDFDPYYTLPHKSYDLDEFELF